MRSTEFRSRFVLYVLLLTYISNQWCRYLLNYLYAVPGSAGLAHLDVSVELGGGPALV